MKSAVNLWHKFILQCANENQTLTVPDPEGWVVGGGGAAAEVAATSEGVVAPSGGGDDAASGGDVVSPSEGSRHLEGVLPSPKQNRFASPSFM